MIDFYGLTSPNVQKIFIMLEECGLPYNFKPVDVWAADNHNPDFVKLNPNKKIPVIVDTEGPGGKPYTVFESGAILMYLAEKTGKFMPADMAKKYDVIQWLMVQMSGVGPAFGNFTHFNLFAPKPGNEYSFSRYKTEMLRLYDLLNDRLQSNNYLGGDTYSIADMATFPWTRQHAAHGVKIDEKPGLKRWFDELSARPAVKAMIAKQNDIKSTRESASDDNKDRFFNRGKYARA
ncbi:MAG: glutathione S-transferase N-terminal domain-containing protein [Hyphomicrobiales bacterium]|nr:glutathione S-transferase N-terminal domain-containing protein [Alphaproteobacteria bacterium]